MPKIPLPLENLQRPIPLDTYQELAKATDATANSSTATDEFPFLGLFGEAGTLLSALKKKQRDGKAYPNYENAKREELGDVLWYTSTIATRAQLTLSEVASASAPDSNAPKTFGELQQHSASSEKELEAALFTLAIKSGELMLVRQPQLSSVNKEVLLLQLSDVLWALGHAAQAGGVTFDDAAYENLLKTYSLRTPTKERTPLFDRRPEHGPLEQLPEKIRMDFVEQDINGTPHVYQILNEIVIGNPLSDNKHTEDGYRYHDVFHLAYAAILGWSPTMRALLRRKRKSKPKVDNSEDGQRAGFLEEGLMALIFQHALGVDYFLGLDKVDYSLLKLIPEFVRGYEAKECALWEWQEAILEGFRVFRDLRDNKGGRVIADLSKRTITFEPLPANFLANLGKTLMT